MSKQKRIRLSEDVKNDSSGDVKYSSINVLNDDCLRLIFEKLSFVERVKVEMVCKSWQNLSKKSWSVVKKLRIDPISFGFLPNGWKHRLRAIDSYVLEQVLKRCGHFLVDIEALDSTVCFLSVISSYCRNVKSVAVRNVSAVGLRDLSMRVSKLTKLCFSGTATPGYISHVDETRYSEYEDALKILLTNNKNIREMKLFDIPCNGDFLRNLSSEKIENISLCVPLRDNGKFLRCLSKKISEVKRVVQLDLSLENLNDSTDLIRKFPSLFGIVEKFTARCLYSEESFGKALSKALVRNTNIKSVHVIYNSPCATVGSWINYINDNLEEITVGQAILSRRSFDRLCNFKNLRDLRFEISGIYDTLEVVALHLS